jgi:DNA-binding MarR family transcriptional regulator
MARADAALPPPGRLAVRIRRHDGDRGATAGRLVDRLEAKGWVERRGRNGDRRVKRIYLTREAERVHSRIWRIAEAIVDDALADLSTGAARN